VPFKGPGDMTDAVIGGHVPPAAPVVTPPLRSNKKGNGEGRGSVEVEQEEKTT